MDIPKTAFKATKNPKIKSKLIITLAAMAISASAMADRSIGAPNCGDWVNSSTPIRKEQYKSWLLGLMTGLNLGDAEGRNSLDKISSAQQIYLWVDNYCKTHPLESVSKAGIMLSIELDKK